MWSLKLKKTTTTTKMACKRRAPTTVHVGAGVTLPQKMKAKNLKENFQELSAFDWLFLIRTEDEWAKVLLVIFLIHVLLSVCCCVKSVHFNFKSNTYKTKKQYIYTCGNNIYTISLRSARVRTVPGTLQNFLWITNYRAVHFFTTRLGPSSI